MSKVLSISIPSELDGTRLDRAIAQLAPELSRNAITRLIEDGRVAIDGTAAAKKSIVVRAEQLISLDIPPPASQSVESQDLPLDVLYQDSDIVVLSKPPGIVVHPAAGHADGTLVNALLFHVGDLSGIGGEVRPGIVHRLDKETSGVMVIAKNDLAHRRLTAAWGTDAVQKEYLALVYGTPKPAEGKIEAPIGRDPKDRKKMAVVRDGRDAITLYKVAESLRGVALVRCLLKTGRTHQIRVHLKHIGHPIVGDPLYSGAQCRGIPDKRLQKTLAAFERQALHAAKLTFVHPSSGEKMTFEAPLPDDMRELIEALRAS
jgi:23S rRNA pseudouridine1911/1915/1917 synthase